MRIVAILVVLLDVFQVVPTSASSFDSTSPNIVLADQDSQFVGEFNRSNINISYNISPRTNVSQFLLSSLELCADAGHPLLFIKNDTFLGCGTLIINSTSSTFDVTKNSRNTTENCTRTPCEVNTTGDTPNRNLTSMLSNVTENSRNTTRNCSSALCEVNTTGDTPNRNLTSMLSNVTENSSNATRNCSSALCEVNTTGDTPNRNLTSMLSNVTENSSNTTRNCSSAFCEVNPTGDTPNRNSTSMLSNVTENSSNTTRNCSSTPCQINSTKYLNFTELVQAYKTEFYSVVSLPVFTLAHFIVQFYKKDRLLVTFSFDPGDGRSLSYANNSTPLLNFSHRYVSHGIFRTRVQGKKISSTLLDISRRVFVNLSSLVQNLSCPNRLPTNKTSFCVLNVLQGKQLDAKVGIGDSIGIKQNISETPVEIISSEDETLREINCTFPGNIGDLNGVFFAPLLVFQRKFYVRAIELFSTQSGPLRLQVFRAVDDRMMDDVFRNVSCPLFLNQTAKVSVCIQTSNFRYHNSSRITSSTTVAAVHNLTIVVTKGYNFLTLRDQDRFIASPGDVVGLTVDQIAAYTSSSLSALNQTSNSSLSASNSSEILNSLLRNSTVTCPGGSFLVFRELSLYGFSPFETRIFLRFMDPGNVPIEISVRDATRHVVNLQQILTVQRPVEGLQLHSKQIVRFNSTQTLGFRVDRGTNTSCVWSLSGRNVDVGGVVNGTVGSKINGNESGWVEKEMEGVETNFNYQHDVFGEFSYSVTCSNKVSKLSKKIVISVRRSITDFNASFCFAWFAYAHARTCWKAAAFGDHVTFKWILGDDVDKGSPFEVVFSNHTSPGSQKSINVSARNVVSTETLTLWFKILENPLSIQIFPSLVVPSLSVVSFSGILTWKDYPNGTAFYQSYAVNISGGLRRFIEESAFRVKIDGKARPGNVSNGTLLNCTFPLAGPSSAIHKVYFEAVGHPEMNREEQITVVDKIQGFRIDSSCSTNVVMNQTCTFTAAFDQGSEVTCNWEIAAQNLTAACQIAYEFRKLGRVTLHATGKNQVSSAKADLNMTIITSAKYGATANSLISSAKADLNMTIITSAYYGTTANSQVSSAKADLNMTIIWPTKYGTTVNSRVSSANSDLNMMIISPTKYGTTANSQVSSANADFNMMIISPTKYGTTANSQVSSANSDLNVTIISPAKYGTTVNSQVSSANADLNMMIISPTKYGTTANSQVSSAKADLNMTIISPAKYGTASRTLPLVTETLNTTGQHVISPTNIPTSRMISANSGSLITDRISSIGPANKLTSSGLEITGFMSRSDYGTVESPFSSSVGPTATVKANQSLGSLKIYGPRFAKVGKEITFSASVVGADVVFSWSINNTLFATQNSSISVTFNQTGLFLVSVNASNQIGHKQVTMFVFAQFTISGLQIKSHQVYFNKSVAVVFTVATGTNVSFLVDFGDGSPQVVGCVRELLENETLTHQFNKSGRYNINITVFNMVDPNVTAGVLVFVKETCIFESVDLYGAPPNLQFSPTFSEMDTIYMSVTPKVKCSSPSNLKFNWRVFNITNSISENVTIRSVNTTMDESVLHFPASQITVGEYKVRVTVIASLDGTSILCEGFFRRVQKNLVAMCICGSARITSEDKPLILNATVVDGRGEGRNLTYKWFCDEKLNISCFQKVISRNSSMIRFPESFFHFGETYNFVVIVTDGNRQGRASQRISVARSNTTLQLCLRCPQDGMKSVLHSQKTEFIASCLDCSASLTWTWCLINISHGYSEYGCEFYHQIVDSNKLTIPPYTLQPNAFYRVEVNGTSLTNSRGYAAYEFLTNDLPSGGFCNVTPTVGYVLRTTFQTLCKSWYDRHQPLFFEYWYSINGQDYTLFYDGENPESPSSYLEAGLRHRNYTVKIKTIIKDSLGASAVNVLHVKNFPLSVNDVDVLLNSPSDIDKRIAILLNNSNTQSAIQFMKTVSGLLNERSNRTEQRNKRIEIREILLRHATKFCCPDRSSVRQTVQVLLVVSRAPLELNLKAQSYASNNYLRLSEVLSSIPSETPIESDARDLVEGISFVLKASSSYGNKPNSDKTQEINEACIRSIDQIGDALLLRLKPGEPPIMITTSLVNIALQNHLTANFPGTRLEVSSHRNEFLVPKTLDQITGGFVMTKFMSMLTNPYFGNSTSSPAPTTGVASLVLKDTQGQDVTIKNLSEPFSMFLYRSGSSIGLLNYSAHLDEHSNPDTYVINITRPNSSLLITLHMVSTNTVGQLRLQIKNHHQTAALSNDIIVSTSSSFPVSTTWKNVNASESCHVTVGFETASTGISRKPYQMQYTISFQEIGCFYWNVTKLNWESNGCQVGTLSTFIRTHCLCNHLTFFGGRLVVPPNTISLSTVAKRINYPKNYATITGVLGSLLFLYIVAVLWARRTDKRDLHQNQMTWCPSNHVTDSYQYQVIVYTGIRRNAGTTAKVGLMLLGEDGMSRRCLLKDSRKVVLKRGGVDVFLISASEYLGALEHIHIWHDSTGSDPAWFLNRVVVLDTLTGQVWNFLCYRWLAVDEGDGQIQRLLPIANKKELVEFRHLFISKATIELTDAHLWFSVSFRPVFSPFTRVQRVSCCLSLLLTSMMTNAMWYKTGGSGTSEVDLGLFSFTWEEVFIGICSSLIVFPVNFLLIQIFRHCRSNREASTTRSAVVTSSQNKSTILSYAMSPEAVSHKLRSQHVASLSPINTESATRDESVRKNTTRNSQDNLLPHWFTYVGWFGVLVTCLTSATVTFLYGVEFGESKTRKWFLSLTISIINDVFVAQPLKVLAIAVVFAYIVKKPLKERYGSHEAIRHDGLESVPLDGLALEAPDPSLCSTEEFLKTAREKHEKDTFMHGLLKTISSYMVFTILILIIAYGQRDPDAYHLTKVQEDTFTRPGIVNKVDKSPFRGIHQVCNVQDFWLWSEVIFLPALSNIQWYNYSGEWSSFTENFGGHLFGAARWRQNRLKRGVCQVLPTFKQIIPGCTGNYHWSGEDTANYFATWNNTLVNISCSLNDVSTDYWCFGSSAELKTYTFIGDLETYRGGGYSTNILQDFAQGLNLIQNLKKQGWIDEYTRAVFIEFTLYNPNVNLFSIVTLLFEVSSSGDFNPSAEILSIRLYNYVGNFQIFVVICQLVFIGFLGYYTYHAGKHLFREQWGFFRKAWNVHELVVVGLSWLAVVFYLISVGIRKWILREFRENPKRFTSFWYATMWQISLEYVIASLVFLVSLRFLHLFQFNRRMFLLPLTLSNTSFELLNYSLLFVIISGAFTMLYHLMLHPYNINFSTIVVTIETMVSVLLGESEAIHHGLQFPVLESVVYFWYVFLMRFVFLVVFVVILNDGFSRARNQNNLQRNDFEFVEFVVHTVYEFLGIRRLKSKPEKRSTKRRGVHFLEEEEPVTAVEQTLYDLEERVDRLRTLINSSSFEEEVRG